MRGYSMLILLQELMYKAYNEAEGRPPKREQIPKPCDYFDLIAGTGTGGLIAIMLGRLRLDLETCKEVYVRMTKKVFETDKTIAGIPYRSTLFKASKLEDAIKDCVREHTIFEDEGNDGTARGGREVPMSPNTPGSTMSDAEKRQSLASVNGGFSPASMRNAMAPIRWGNPSASLYDSRENRTKTLGFPTFIATKCTKCLLVPLPQFIRVHRGTAARSCCDLMTQGRSLHRNSTAASGKQEERRRRLDWLSNPYRSARKFFTTMESAITMPLPKFWMKL